MSEHADCWLCEGMGGVAVHGEWTERRGKTLLTPHRWPSDDPHVTYPCPLRERDEALAELEQLRSDQRLRPLEQPPMWWRRKVMGGSPLSGLQTGETQ